jgi:hypothetical protein
VRLLADESLSESLVDALHDLFPGSLHVRQMGHGGATAWLRPSAEPLSFPPLIRLTRSAIPSIQSWLHRSRAASADGQRRIHMALAGP